jgi:hypothetical protein|tara:strand:+ start:233 stop:454 length:222 start_codon:yes stop_codon:yes gene_type:complete
MAKKTAVKEKYAGHKRPMPGMEVKTPYPKKAKKDEIDYLGNKLADLSERVNEVELSIADLSNKINRVMGRMGL